MKKIKFTKMIASGNDFVIIDWRYALCAMRYAFIAKKICDRKFGIGADGLLVLEKSKIADAKMRVFNADGSEAEMCGNGARCVALFLSAQRTAHSACLPVGKAQCKIETKAGVINAEVSGGNVKIKLTDPKGIRLDIPIKVNNRRIKANFINTGVAHTVIFVEGLDKIDVVNLGRQIRSHQKFMPKGTNVDFVELLNNGSIKVRTYERGVEDETLACGTGAVASALLATCNLQLATNKINVLTRSGEILKVYFRREGNRFTDVWLEGKASIVYKGEYYV